MTHFSQKQTFVKMSCETRNIFLKRRKHEPRWTNFSLSFAFFCISIKSPIVIRRKHKSWRQHREKWGARSIQRMSSEACSLRGRYRHTHKSPSLTTIWVKMLKARNINRIRKIHFSQITFLMIYNTAYLVPVALWASQLPIILVSIAMFSSWIQSTQRQF